ncbi:MAG: hypothetical protein PVG79_15075 [Gemmatimonadales bacterium]|jgi:hypothetical protein
MTQSSKVETGISVRSAIDQTLTILGVIIIVVTVTLLTESWTPLFIVIVGTLMIGAGAWRLGTRLLPNRRIYVGLRSEVEYFIRLVRRLNSHALAEETEKVENLRVEMKESVDRMVSLAGQVGVPTPGS